MRLVASTPSIHLSLFVALLLVTTIIIHNHTVYINPHLWSYSKNTVKNKWLFLCHKGITATATRQIMGITDLPGNVYSPGGGRTQMNFPE